MNVHSRGGHKNTVLIVMGTRPEAIKLAPVIAALKSHPQFIPLLCVTGQHPDLLPPLLDLFRLRPDFTIPTVSHDSQPSSPIPYFIRELSTIMGTVRPSLVLVQGDTSSALAGAMAAHYQHIAIGHIEAGLRSGNIQAPWPEEGYRRLISSVSTYHFAPTQTTADNLLREGIDPSHVHVTGNTTIDSLHHIKQQLNDTAFDLAAHFPALDWSRKLILVTAHRRENQGVAMENICNALLQIARRTDCQIVFPVHPNPTSSDTIYRRLGGQENIHLLPPLDYLPFIALMQKSYLLLTDSGGLQEEASALNLPTLVLRDNTERPEAIATGANLLVGTAAHNIITAVSQLVENNEKYKIMANAHNPYGQGNSAVKIVSILSKYYRPINIKNSRHI